MTLKPRPEGARYYDGRRAMISAIGLRDVCQDCGMRIAPEHPRFVLNNGHTYTHAEREQCIEGHGDDPEWGPDSAQQMLERGPR